MVRPFFCRYLLAPLLFLSGWLQLEVRTQPHSPHDLRAIAGTEPEWASVRGVIQGTPKERITIWDGEEIRRTVSFVGVRELRRDGERAWQPARGRIAVSNRGFLDDAFFAGQTIEVSGVLSVPAGAVARGLFDYRGYLERHGAWRRLRVNEARDFKVWSRDDHERKPPLSAAFQRWARRTLSLGLPNAEADPIARLMQAMALGWKTGLTDEVAKPFMRSGTMHLFAVSGLHVGLIALILMNLMRVFLLPRAVCGILTIGLLWFYAAATGWQASAVRATIMSCVLIAGWSLQRPLDPVNSLAGAGFLILLWEPQQVFRAGFQLSFAVVFSLVWVAPQFERFWKRIVRHDPFLPEELIPRWKRAGIVAVRWTMRMLGASFAAWMGALPLVACYFHLWTPVSLLANLVIVPLAFPTLASCLGSLVCGAWAGWLAELFNHSAWASMASMAWLSGRAAELPGAWWPMPAPPGWVVAGYYAVWAGVCCGWWRNGPRPALRIGILALGGLAVVLAYIVVQPAPELTVLSVQGGDAILMDERGRRDDVLIDAGIDASARYSVGPLLQARGIKRLGTLVLTHGDKQHVEGAVRVAEEFEPHRIVTGTYSFRSRVYRDVVEEIEELQVPRVRVERGGRIGRWEVLHPRSGDPFTRADDQAMVLRAQLGELTVLLLSDLGRSGQRLLYERERNLRADVLIVGVPLEARPPHPGFLAAVAPRAIVVSSSTYPAQERANGDYRRELAGRGIPVFYTDECGSVVLAARGSRLRVRSMRGGETEWLD